MTTVEKVKPATREERMTLARDFAASHKDAISITRDNFDIWIIDNRLAIDPETDNPSTGAYKGFVQERTQARNLINRCARLLPEGDSYEVAVIKTDGDNIPAYAIRRWGDSALARAADIGNRVEKFGQNKLASVNTDYLRVCRKLHNGENVGDLPEMLHQLAGANLEMQRRISAEVAKFNLAADMVAAATAQLSLESALVSEDSATA